MKKNLVALVSLFLLSFLVSAQDKVSLTPEMSQNLHAMNQIMLHLLVDENYLAASSNCSEIVQHAKDIVTKIPVKEADQVAKFKSYAIQLEANADILRVIAEKIHKSKVEKAPVSESLKKSAALTYGQIVTSCVSCHQEFRVR